MWFDLIWTAVWLGGKCFRQNTFPPELFHKIIPLMASLFPAIKPGGTWNSFCFCFLFFIGCLFLLSTVLSTWSGRWACFDLKETKRTLYRLFSVQAFKKGPWFDPNRVESANQTRVCSCVIEGILFNSEESWAHATTVATIWHSFNVRLCHLINKYRVETQVF